MGLACSKIQLFVTDLFNNGINNYVVKGLLAWMYM